MKEVRSAAKQVVPVCLEPAQVEWLEALAKRHDRTKGYFIRQAVREFRTRLGSEEEAADADTAC